MADVSKSCSACRHCVIRDISMWFSLRTLIDGYERAVQIPNNMDIHRFPMCLHHGIRLPQEWHDYVCDDWEGFETKKDILRKIEG